MAVYGRLVMAQISDVCKYRNAKSFLTQWKHSAWPIGKSYQGSGDLSSQGLTPGDPKQANQPVMVDICFPKLTLGGGEGR